MYINLTESHNNSTMRDLSTLSENTLGVYYLVLDQWLYERKMRRSHPPYVSK